MNYLVLGGNGFLGSRVIDRLLKSYCGGDSVVACTVVKNTDISCLKDNLDRIVIIDADEDSVKQAVEKYHFDYVVNTVCSYGRNNAPISGVVEANFAFPFAVLNMFTKADKVRFLSIGTALPDDLNLYSYSKAMYAHIARFYTERYNIDFYNIKLQMFYSAEEPSSRFLPFIISEMLKGNEVRVTEGKQKRDIIHADDVITAIVNVLHSGLSGYVEVPVGTGTAPSVSDLVDYIWEQTGKKSKVLKGAVKARQNEPDCVSDNTVISAICDWNPVPWQTGIKNMIDEISKSIGEVK